MFKKFSSGTVDAMKAAKLVLKNNEMSSNCVLLVDEMYLEKSVQNHGGNFLGQDEEGNCRFYDFNAFNAFSHLLNKYNEDKKLYIYHPANIRLLINYLCFDIVHLIKNIRNKLLSRKKLFSII